MRKKNRNETLDALVDLDGFEDDTLADLALAGLVALQKNDPFASLLDEAIDIARLEEVLDEAVFEKPDADSDGPIAIGDAKETDLPVRIGLYPVDLTRMVLVVGTHGSGKTTVVARIVRQIIRDYSCGSARVCVFVFDTKIDYCGLYHEFEDLRVVSWEWLCFNPLQVPKGVSPKTWRNTFVDLFCGVFTIGDMGYSLLLQAIERLYCNHGVYEGSGAFPTIRQVRGYLWSMQKSTDPFRKKEALASLLNRLDGLLTSWPEGMDYCTGWCVPELTTAHTVLAVNGLAEDHRAFLVSLVCMWEYTFAEAAGRRGEKLRTLFVIDEAELILGKDIRKAITRTPLFFTSIARFREFGIGTIVSSQSPRGLDERSVLALSRTKIIKNMVDYHDIRYIADSLGWDADQRDYCRKMTADEAAVSLGERQPDSALVSVPYESLNKKIDWAEFKKKMLPVLGAAFETTPPFTRVEEKRSEESHDPDVHRCLVDVLNHPFTPKTERLTGLFGASTSKQQRLAKHLVEEGFVKEYKVHIGGRSGMATLWQLKQKGYALIRAERRALPSIGDLTHQYLAHRISEKVREWGLKPVVEMRRSGKHVDVGVEAGEDTIAIEIATTAKNEANNVQKDKQAGFSRIVIVCLNDIVLRAVQKKIDLARDRKP